MILLLLLFVTIKSTEPEECYGPYCYYPIIFHNFTNCPPMPIMRRFGPPPPYVKTCANEGTWGCSNFTAYYPHPEEGFVREGSIHYSLKTCCDIKSVRTIETVITPHYDFIAIRRSDEEIIEDDDGPEPTVSSFKWEVHNIEIYGVAGTCIITDERFQVRRKLPLDDARRGVPPDIPYVYIEDCYEDNEEDLHLALNLFYNDVADKCFEEPGKRRFGWGPDSCSMYLEFYVYGDEKFNGSVFTMNKIYGFQMGDFYMIFNRLMYEYEGEGSLNDKIKFVRAYDVNLPKSEIKHNAENWATQTPQDGYCINNPCEYIDCVEHTQNTVTESIRYLFWGKGLMALILLGIILFMCLFLCPVGVIIMCFAFIREQTKK